MSWNISLPVTPADEFEAAVEALVLDTHGGIIEYTSESFEQLAAAKAAVLSIWRSGAVGSREGIYTAHLAGHTNPGHRPTRGWSNDVITVTVYQADQQPPAINPPDAS